NRPPSPTQAVTPPEHTLEKKAIDWSKLGFEYTRTDFRFSATWQDGQWSEGELVTSEIIQLHEGSPALHYAQQCFEGLKAQTAKDGRILLFRPELNCERMQKIGRASCRERVQICAVAVAGEKNKDENDGVVER